MRKVPIRFLAASVAAACLGGAIIPGCGAMPPRPPQSLAELQRHRQSGVKEFTPSAIALHNARRVVSADLPVRARLESLKVVERLDVPVAGADSAMASILSRADTPDELRPAVLAYLGGRGYPGLAAHMAAALPQAADATHRRALLKWFQENPSPEVLAEVVKLWARERDIDRDSELQYRLAVGRTCNAAWDEALLDQLNAPGFLARGSALEVLAGRVDHLRLRERILAIRPRTEAIRTLQFFAGRFGALPATRGELLAMVLAYRGGSKRLARAAELGDAWRKDTDYAFNIRDFHLLESLAGDPLRKRLSRRRLIAEVSREIARRRGRAGGLPPGAAARMRRGKLVDFDAQIDGLTMADLWNIHLIQEMFAGGLFPRALKIMLRRDRQDTQGRWGGLIAYAYGRAGARLYEPAAKRGPDTYVPSRQMLREAMDSMGWFVNHFGRDATDLSAIGPSDDELAFARRRNLCGIVLTSLTGRRVNATYFNPSGAVVDLGKLTLGR